MEIKNTLKNKIIVLELQVVVEYVQRLIYGKWCSKCGSATACHVASNLEIEVPKKKI